MKKELVNLLNDLTEEELDLMLNDLYEFYFNLIAIRYADHVDAPHIKEIADKLTELYLNETDKHLCISIAPRHSKSSIVTLTYPLWLIFQNPDLNILIVNAEASLSENFGIRLREYVKEYGEIFDVYLSDVKHSSTHIKFEDKNGRLYKGSIRLTGASGSITGQDADILILDDVYKGFQDIVPSLLEKKIEWFKTMILQRKEPNTKLLILHTRWASNDLTGYLMENSPDKYDFISYPAIKEDGTPLWKERYTIDFLNAQKEEMGERLFSSIFQQRPLDETGSFFNLEKIVWHDEPFDFRNKTIIGQCRSWDLAFSDESKGIQRDSTAGIPMYKLADNYYVITDFEFGQYGEGLKNHIINTAKKDGPNMTILLETGTSGGSSEFLFYEYRKDLQGFICLQSKPVGSKVDRAYPFREAILDGKIHVHITNEYLRGEFIKQLKSFPLGKHDDIIDACAYAFNHLSKRGGSTVKVGRIMPRKDIMGNPYIPKRRKSGRFRI